MSKGQSQLRVPTGQISDTGASKERVTVTSVELIFSHTHISSSTQES